MTAARSVDFTAYRPLREDEPGLTDRQVAERRHATRLVAMRRYEAEMTDGLARLVLGKSTAELMAELDLDEEQAGDVADVARRYLERVEREREEGVNRG